LLKANYDNIYLLKIILAKFDFGFGKFLFFVDVEFEESIVTLFCILQFLTRR